MYTSLLVSLFLLINIGSIQAQSSQSAFLKQLMNKGIISEYSPDHLPKLSKTKQRDLGPIITNIKARSNYFLLSGLAKKDQESTLNWISAKTNKRLIRIHSHKLSQAYIGETEKNIDRLFQACQSKGWILFFDEADALFGKRTEVKDSHDRYANQEVSYLIKKSTQSKVSVIILLSDLNPAWKKKYRGRWGILGNN